MANKIEENIQRVVSVSKPIIHLLEKDIAYKGCSFANPVKLVPKRRKIISRRIIYEFDEIA